MPPSHRHPSLLLPWLLQPLCQERNVHGPDIAKVLIFSYSFTAPPLGYLYYLTPYEHDWQWHLAKNKTGATCKTYDDCSDEYDCINGTCAPLGQKSSCAWEGHCEGMSRYLALAKNKSLHCVLFFLPHHLFPHDQLIHNTEQERRARPSTTVAAPLCVIRGNAGLLLESTPQVFTPGKLDEGNWDGFGGVFINRRMRRSAGREGIWNFFVLLFVHLFCFFPFFLEKSTTIITLHQKFSKKSFICSTSN